MIKAEESIEVTTTAVSKSIHVLVKMLAPNESSCDYTTSIDELGQIVLTPNNNETEFVSATLIEELDEPFAEILTTDGQSVTKEFVIDIRASMISESENTSLDVVIDEINQVVIYPVEKSNMFVSASVENSLNLVTEELEVIDYYGYILLNNGDGWDVKDPLGNLVEEGCATLAEAKVVALTREIHILENTLEESVDSDSEVEGLSETQVPEIDTDEIISKFLMGELSLFTDEGKPEETFVKIDELSHGNYVYYYDPESGAVVSYYEGE